MFRQTHFFHLDPSNMGPNEIINEPNIGPGFMQTSLKYPGTSLPGRVGYLDFLVETGCWQFQRP